MKTYYLLRIASWLARLIPVRTAYHICSLIGGIIFYLNPTVREAVIDNMKHVMPGSSRHDRRALARRVIRNAVKNYYDLVRLPYLDKREVEHKITAYGIEHLDNALAQGKGVIIVGCHMGNYNVVPQVAAARGYTITIVAEDIKPHKLSEYVNRVRARFGLKMVTTGSSEVRQIYRSLKKGEGLVLAADRDVTGEGIPVQFFDAPADLPPGPVALALRLGTPLVPAYARRLPSNSNAVYLLPPIELERTGDNERDVLTNLRKVAQVTESMILKAPDQWVVLQRVWDRDYTEDTASTSEADATGAEPELELGLNSRSEEAQEPPVIPFPLQIPGDGRSELSEISKQKSEVSSQ
jgi:lauroyl/myristoyl acyltransferase